MTFIRMIKAFRFWLLLLFTAVT